ncbi:GroES-like protein [Delitschia confertaspora ATCC 74209]|uniref:GroES-like protein n=1 Tax=Delitschia confertaspora ATCC 74209 TaxID=1513339 RepID=A0A9P4MNY2_9PLEO|nr:GroES-like protein [Delitschia confertaspora ATCC 74209]
MVAKNLGAKLAETVLGHGDQDRATHTDISNPDREGGQYADLSGEKMKAMVWMAKNDMRIVEASKPTLVDDHDVIVRVTGSTVCGSDVHLMHGVVVQVEKGDILGHEFCSIVDTVGPAVSHLKVGERVVNSFVVSCGECSFCKQNLTTACERTNASTVQEMLYGSRTGGIFGYSHFTGGYAGGQAEYVRVPIGEQSLLKLPGSVPDEKGLYLSDVLPTSYHSVSDTGVYEGDCVAIWGLGPMGLMACFWAFRKGAKRVIDIDKNWRTEYAKSKIPGLETINFSGGEYVKSWTHRVELSLSLEQDISEMVNECIMSTRKFGRVGIIADYTGYWKELLQLVESGQVDPTIMLTHRITMDDIAKSYYAQEKQSNGLVKCYVETRFSAPRAEGTQELTSL